MSIRRKIAAAAGTAALAGALSFTATPAQAAGNLYTIPAYGVAIHFSNGYCLDVPNADAYGQQIVQTWWCNNTDAQRWNIIPVDSTHFQIQSVLEKGKYCLNNYEGGDVTGNYIRLYDCGTSPDRVFNFVYKGIGWQLQPKSASVNCVNMWGGDQRGNEARLYPCASVSNENVWWRY
ncbi:RICIN domain-containing protein [Kitasatospora sp. NPDC097643]|uniref:RICIN domain-containing protein n=1 Tax=Kitasatospora sp. NPDC097643 TaxID=3157230 RepID=UPI00332F03E9